MSNENLAANGAVPQVPVGIVKQTPTGQKGKKLKVKNQVTRAAKILAALKISVPK